MANIKDVAKKAGVSITTVSMVLNNTNNKISEATRGKVIKAAKDLKYNPNSYARALASKKGNSIMVVIPDIANPFYAAIIKELTYYARKKNYFLYIHNTNNKAMEEEEFISILKNNYFMASFVVDRNVNGLSEEDIRKHNIIFLDEYDFTNRKTNIVTGNNEKGGYLAVEYLIKRGYKNIGMLIGPRSTANSSRRLSGAIKASMDYDVYIDSSNMIHGDYSYKEGYKAGKFFLEKNIDAIFSFADMSSYGLINYFKEKNIIIGKDMSIISYDNLFFDEIISPGLTSIDQNLRKLAKEAISMADDLINDRKTKGKIVIEPRIVERESVGIKNENS